MSMSVMSYIPHTSPAAEVCCMSTAVEEVQVYEKKRERAGIPSTFALANIL